MQILWAPWRMKYIKASAKKNGGSANICGGKKTNKCIFCRGVKSAAKNYVVLKTKYSISMLNIFPYNNGHMMIAPIRHIKELAQLKEAEIMDLIKTLKMSKKLLDKVLKPEGYNIGLNLSESAGAGIPGHLHIHLVPRWRGDTNFMPVLANTRVISQSLDELYRQLRNVVNTDKHG